MKSLFFINPAAGKGAAQAEIVSQIKSYFAQSGGEYEIITTRFAGDAEQQALKAAQSGEELKMFACGGEGTGYEILNGIVGFDNVQMGIIPCGSANDFLKYFPNRKPFGDISAQLSGEVHKIDIIKAGERYCMNSCSVGMDAMVAKDMKFFKRLPFVSGSFAYKLAIARNFFKRRLGMKLKIYVDNQCVGERCFLFALAANAPFYGGGYKGAPSACINDGLLAFTAVNGLSHFRVLPFLSKYEKGEFSNLDFCCSKSCTSMRFEAEKAVPVNLDGEIYENKSLEFSVVPAALNFILPKGVEMPNC